MLAAHSIANTTIDKPKLRKVFAYDITKAGQRLGRFYLAASSFIHAEATKTLVFQKKMAERGLTNTVGYKLEAPKNLGSLGHMEFYDCSKE